MPTIVYLHGFRSSPASVKATLFARAVEALPDSGRPSLHIPFLRESPQAAITEVRQWIEHSVDDPSHTLTLIGSSLGGFYATYLCERFNARAVVINPAIRPFEDLASYRGPQTNMYTGATFVVTDAHMHELRALAVRRLAHPERYWMLVQTGDEVLDYREAIAFYAGAHQLVEGGGDHSFRGFEKQVPAILRFAGLAA
ncbi:MAG TPA: YqiA/YcfP family alpha/beta fold hydrolase [Casimicrobiaceae bacterium]|nr:YqiA/YcfP family alpha/beta fold hydrolase [Casimicrobiaceae bacterium]